MGETEERSACLDLGRGHLDSVHLDISGIQRGEEKEDLSSQGWQGRERPSGPLRKCFFTGTTNEKALFAKYKKSSLF